MVVEQQLHLQTNGVVTGVARDGEVVSALFALSDGGLSQLSMASDGGGEFVAEHAPSGPWMAKLAVPGSIDTYFEVTGDRSDLSTVVMRGRAGARLPANATFAFSLMVQPWDPAGFVQVTSQSAGSRFDFFFNATTGTTYLSGSLQPTGAVGGPIRSTDELRISQFAVTATLPGPGEFFTITGSAAVTSFLIPGDVLTTTLLPLSVTTDARIQLDAGLFQSAPSTPASRCALQVHEETAGVRTANAPFIATGFWSPASLSIDVNIPYPPGARLASSVGCARSLLSPLPLSDGGAERIADGGVAQAGLFVWITAVDHLSLDGGLVSVPSPDVPRAIQIDGSPSPGVVSGSPWISWTAPLNRTPRRYEVVIQRLVRPINYPDPVARLHTFNTQVRVPPGILIPGERYAFEVSAIFSGPPDPQRPFREVLPFASAPDQSAIVVVR
ncbi:MAG: hypothetical protein Q8L14_39350 [Myxococcales bacterium]|nr:hypothetical protein [Myxococcales bacterium]